MFIDSENVTDISCPLRKRGSQKVLVGKGPINFAVSLFAPFQICKICCCTVACLVLIDSNISSSWREACVSRGKDSVYGGDARDCKAIGPLCPNQNVLPGYSLRIPDPIL